MCISEFLGGQFKKTKVEQFISLEVFTNGSPINLHFYIFLNFEFNRSYLEFNLYWWVITARSCIEKFSVGYIAGKIISTYEIV